MNHLAHVLLSTPAPAQRLGNLFGDAVRGPLRAQDLPAGVIEGVRRHRRIDAMTDRHPESTRLRALFPSSLRRYAGIILDVAFDHHLTRTWPTFCDVSRESFTLEVYGIMHRYPSLLPDRVRPLAPRMIAHDFLNRCETVDGVMAVLSHIDARLSRGFDLCATRRALEDLDAALEEGFRCVFADVHHELGSGPHPGVRSAPRGQVRTGPDPKETKGS